MVAASSFVVSALTGALLFADGVPPDANVGRDHDARSEVAATQPKTDRSDGSGVQAPRPTTDASATNADVRHGHAAEPAPPRSAEVNAPHGPDNGARSGPEHPATTALVLVVEVGARADAAKAILQSAEQAGVKIVRVELEANPSASVELTDLSALSSPADDVFAVRADLRERLTALGASRVAFAIVASEARARTVRATSEASARARGFVVIGVSEALEATTSGPKSAMRS